MITNPFSAAEVYRLRPEQVESIVLAYHKATKDPAYHSGKASLSGSLGEHLDTFDLEMIEDAARSMSESPHFRQAITWAWLAYRFHRRVAAIEFKSMTAPWVARD